MHLLRQRCFDYSYSLAARASERLAPAFVAMSPVLVSAPPSVILRVSLKLCRRTNWNVSAGSEDVLSVVRCLRCLMWSLSDWQWLYQWVSTGCVASLDRHDVRRDGGSTGRRQLNAAWSRDETRRAANLVVSRVTWARNWPRLNTHRLALSVRPSVCVLMAFTNVVVEGGWLQSVYDDDDAMMTVDKYWRERLIAFDATRERDITGGTTSV